MSLYRTYRPRTFAEVLGQDHIVTTLESAIEQDQVSHAYLFAGPRGTGKTSVARILAGHQLTRGITDEALKRQIQKGVEEGSIVDLIEIDAASNTGVDNIRDLIEKIQFSPVVAAAKVYIIDEAHMLSKGAFSALLKTLEEPPAYAYFILATTELQKIPTTIQSRCQRFAFRPIHEEDLMRGLQTVADRERIEIDRLALRAIARSAGGGMRDALSLLDQLRALPTITLEDVRERIGEGADATIEALLEAMDHGDAARILSIVRETEDAGFPLDVLTRQLLSAIRTRLHEAATQEQPLDRHMRMLDQLLDALRDMRLSPVEGLVLESALVTLAAEAEPEKKSFFSRKKSDVSQSAAEVEKSDALAKAKSAVKNPGEEPEPPQEDLKNASVEAPPVTLESLRGVWPTVLRETTPPSVRMSLKNGQIKALRDGTVVVGFASSFHKDKVASTEASRKVEEILEKIFKRSLRLECMVDTGAEDIADEKPVNLADAVGEIF